MAAGRRRVVWTPGARTDLDEAVEYISTDSPTAALTVLDRILEVAASLAELGDRGRILPELEDPLIRELLSDPFRIVYRVTPEAVEILGILHQRRDLKLWDRSELGPVNTS